MFIVDFVEYLKDLLEKLSICIENRSKFVHSESCFGNGKLFLIVLICSAAGVLTGIRRSLLLLSVSRSVMLLSYCFATQRLEMTNANIYMAYI